MKEITIVPKNDLNNNPSTITFKEKVGALYCNGGLILQQFQLSEIPRFDSVHYRIAFVSHIFSSTVFQETLPNLEDIDPTKIATDDSSWQYSIDWFEKRLSEDLHWAGAYTSMEPIEADKLAKSIIGAIVPNREDSFCVNLKPLWSSWFYLIAWDYAFLIVDKKEITLTLICATDTD